MNYLRKIVEALKLASPVCLAGRFDDGLAHCVEASVYGAKALALRNIKATAVPCAIVGVNDENTRNLSLGLSAREIFERYQREVGETLEYEPWKAKNLPGVPDDVAPIYMVIRANFHSEHVLIDLTAGQLGRVSGAEFPMQIDATGPADKWPSFASSGWTVEYVETPRAAMVLDAIKGMTDPGYVADLQSLMDVALRCELDFTRFHGELAEKYSGYEAISERLSTMLAPPRPQAPRLGHGHGHDHSH